MKVMALVKATPHSEAGEMPPREIFEAMGLFNDALVKAGILLAADGLKPSRGGNRVHFSGASRAAIDGPFAEAKELVAGFWLWEVSSMAEAVEWVKRCPNPMLTESDVEIRPLYSAEEFADVLAKGDHHERHVNGRLYGQQDESGPARLRPSP